MNALRNIRNHIVNPTNDRLEISVMDEPGHGGASHHYRVRPVAPDGLPADAAELKTLDWAQHVIFQIGPINEHGVNGTTHEVLLAIVADRLRSFQNGPFPSDFNKAALDHVEHALAILKQRTQDRMNRGVEGQTKA